MADSLSTLTTFTAHQRRLAGHLTEMTEVLVEMATLLERVETKATRYIEALDSIEFACDTATDDSLRGSVRSMIRRARNETLTTTEETRADGD